MRSEPPLQPDADQVSTSSADPIVPHRPRHALVVGSLWNAIGTAAPALVALPAMGLLARRLGAERFGLVTLAWALFGYFAILDLGIARSVCWMVARDPADRAAHRRILGTALWAGLAVSSALGAVGLVFVPTLVDAVSVSADVVPDAVKGARLLLLVLPVLVVTTILQAFLEGRQEFRDISLQRAVIGVAMALAPVAFVAAAPTFTAAVGGLLLARAAGLVLSFLRVRARVGPGSYRFERATFARLIGFGGWIAVSNFVYPLMSYVDRFWFSHRMGAAQVAVYTGPSELIARALSMPVAIARAVFPSLSDASVSEVGRDAAARKAFRLVLFTSGPTALLVVLGAAPLMTVWLGGELGSSGAPVLRVLAIGFLFNSMAQIPFSVLQARGDARATAVLHAVEVVPYFALLLFLGPRYGAVGVAWAWTIRVALDFGLLFIAARRRAR